MNTRNDYLSEFEQEFEVDSFSSEDGEITNLSDEYEDEFENDFSSESNEELEFQDEYELNDEYELESEQSDSEFENYLQEHTPNQEFEDRLYSVLSGEYESSFEMEQEIDRVLHEMEVEYFWKAAKNLWKKHKNKLLPLAKTLIPGGNLTTLAKYGGSILRGALKNKLVKGALTSVANVYAPGIGGAMVGKLLNSETPANRIQAKEAVRIAKDAYRNMAQLVPNLRPGNIPNQIGRLSNQALTMAKKRGSAYQGKTRQVIRRRPDSIVVVRPDRIIIYS